MKKFLYTFLGLFILLVLIGVFVPSPKTEPATQARQIDSQLVSTKTDETSSTEATPTSKISTATEPETTDISFKYYPVTSVVDGDTIKINVEGAIKTFRLIGMDTPETVDPRKEVQCFGMEASNKAKELLLGKKVRIETDVSQGTYDKYNRLLGYVYREDGLFYNKYMIEQGYAHEYTYDIPYKYQAEFKNAQATAEKNQVGLWSPNTCNGDTTSSSTSNQTVPATTTQSNGQFYTSSYSTAKYYYPASCDGWKSLSTKYLKSFDSLETLLIAYPSRTESPQCQ